MRAAGHQQDQRALRIAHLAGRQEKVRGPTQPVATMCSLEFSPPLVRPMARGRVPLLRGLPPCPVRLENGCCSIIDRFGHPTRLGEDRRRSWRTRPFADKRTNRLYSVFGGQYTAGASSTQTVSFDVRLFPVSTARSSRPRLASWTFGKMTALEPFHLRRRSTRNAR